MSSKETAFIGGHMFKADVHEEAWNESVATVENLLHGVKEHSQEESSEDRVARKEQSTPTRWDEVEEARADRASRLAQHPRGHIGIAARMEHLELGEGNVEERAPMHKAVIPGYKERFDLVDVHAVRLRCRQLETGITVKALLEQTRVEERQAAILSLSNSRSAPSSLFKTKKLGSASSVGAGGATAGWPSRADPAGLRDRVQRAQARKKASGFDSMLRKLHNMRGNPSEQEMARFNHAAQEVSDSNALPVVERVNELAKESPVRRTFYETCALHQDLPITNEIACSPVAMERRRTSLNNGDTKVPVQGKLSMRALVQHRLKQKRIESLGRTLRGVVRYLCVYFRHARKTKAAFLVKTFLHELTEFTKLKLAISRLNRSLKVLYRSCKEFVHIRRERIDEMHQMWQEVEDRHLRLYFRLFAKEAAEEQKKAKVQGRSLTDRKKQVKIDFLKRVVLSEDGWQKLRIPDKERSAVINSYYSVKLRKQAQNHKELQGVVESSMPEAKLNREVTHFVGDTNVPGIPQWVDSAMAIELKWWELSEDTVLDLISFAVSWLKQVEPFSRHPSSGGLQLDSPMWNRSPQRGALLVGSLIHRRLARRIIRPKVTPRASPRRAAPKSTAPTEWTFETPFRVPLK